MDANAYNGHGPGMEAAGARSKGFLSGLFSNEHYVKREAEDQLKAQEESDDDADEDVRAAGQGAQYRERKVWGAQERLAVGAEVQIHSLTSEAALHYNEFRGELLRFDLERGRWDVRITTAEADCKGKVLALKPANLQRIMAHCSRGAAGETSVAAAGEDARLEIGALVQVHSLTGAPEHNNKHGILESLDPATGRWVVRLVISGGASKHLSLKIQNVAFLLSAAEMALAERLRPPKGTE